MDFSLFGTSKHHFFLFYFLVKFLIFGQVVNFLLQLADSCCKFVNFLLFWGERQVQLDDLLVFDEALEAAIF